MTIKTPVNIIELLETLRDVLKNRLAFDKAFYAEENIKQITNARKITVTHNPENTLIKVEANDFRAITDHLKPDGRGLSISITLKTLPGGKKNAFISGSIRSAQPLLHYHAIEKIIGFPWKTAYSEDPVVSKNRLYPEATDPHGNAERKYFYQDGNITESGFFRFSANGLLEDFTLRNEEESNAPPLLRQSLDKKTPATDTCKFHEDFRNHPSFGQIIAESSHSPTLIGLIDTFPGEFMLGTPGRGSFYSSEDQKIYIDETWVDRIATSNDPTYLGKFLSLIAYELSHALQAIERERMKDRR